MDFEDYVRQRYPSLRRLGFLLSADWAVADDLVQTALIRCEPRWARITDPDPYVRRAVVNTAHSWRLRRRLHAPLSALDGCAAPSPDSDERLAVVAALRALPLGQRQVLVLRYYEGLPESEIAEVLGVSAGTVKSRAARGLSALRLSDLRDLAPQGGGA